MSQQLKHTPFSSLGFNSICKYSDSKMGFWGVEVKPGKPYKYEFDDVYEKLNVTQAVLGDGSSTQKSAVQCSVGSKSPVMLCSFLPNNIETCPLNLKFDGSDSVAFSVVGPRSVHLSGFLEVNDQDTMEEDYNSYSSGEDIAVTDSDQSTDYDSEDDELEGDFIDDGGFGFLPSFVPNSGVVIEEIVEDEKPVNDNSHSKQPKKKKQASESIEQKKAKQQIVAKSSSTAIAESEDEDGFPIASTKKDNLNAEKPNSDSGEKTTEKATRETKKKRKRDVSDHAGKSEGKDGNMEDTKSATVPEDNIKKKNNKKQKQSSEDGTTNVVSVEPPVKNEQDLEMSNDNEAVEKKKKKKKKKIKTQESADDGNVAKNVTPSGDAKKGTVAVDGMKAKASQVRTFSNGLLIEELAMGKPDGKRASPGNTVSVHYIGKLQKNGSIFDSNIGNRPFKFRLGVGQVIKGWDIGVNGMRIGDKRRLTIPPSMGYGAKGVGKIPRNAWLMFDVELVDVR